MLVDVREPNEQLRLLGAAGEFVVLGRVVLGKTTPVVYEVRVGDELVRGRIPVLVVSGMGTPGPHDMPEGARFIPKPYEPRTLVRTLRAFVQRAA